MVDFSKSFQFFVLRISQSYNPGIAVTIPVWAPSISLAATLEIDVSFFSSSYLDVSVQRVSPHCWVTGLLPAGLSHSDIRGSILVCKSRDFSQLTTSFFASKSLGIPHTLFITFFFHTDPLL